MEYFSSEQLYKYFESEIKSSANSKMNQLRKEIDELKARELKKIDDELKESIDQALSLELKELKTDHSYEINRIMTDNARILMNKRLELLNSVFDDVKKKLLAFSSTEAYTKLMKKKIAVLNQVFKDQEVVFDIKKGDSLLTEVINHDFLGKYTIQTNEKIQFGGFYAACIKKGIEVDETLDFKLDDKKQWFYEKSNLYIKK